MPRYVLVISAATALVTNPHAINASPPRFAGRVLRATPPSPKAQPEDEHPDLVDHYECVEEVLIDDPHLRKAIAKGDLILLCVVTAKTRAEADKLFDADKAKRASAAPPAVEPASAPPAKASKSTTAASAAPIEVK